MTDASLTDNRFTNIVYAPHLGVNEKKSMIANALGTPRDADWPVRMAEYKLFKTGLILKAEGIQKLLAETTAPLGVLMQPLFEAARDFNSGVSSKSINQQFSVFRSHLSVNKDKLEKAGPSATNLKGIFELLAATEENMNLPVMTTEATTSRGWASTLEVMGDQIAPRQTHFSQSLVTFDTLGAGLLQAYAQHEQRVQFSQAATTLLSTGPGHDVVAPSRAEFKRKGPKV